MTPEQRAALEAELAGLEKEVESEKTKSAAPPKLTQDQLDEARASSEKDLNDPMLANMNAPDYDPEATRVGQAARSAINTVKKLPGTLDDIGFAAVNKVAEQAGGDWSFNPIKKLETAYKGVKGIAGGAADSVKESIKKLIDNPSDTLMEAGIYSPIETASTVLGAGGLARAGGKAALAGGKAAAGSKAGKAVAAAAKALPDKALNLTDKAIALADANPVKAAAIGMIPGSPTNLALALGRKAQKARDAMSKLDSKLTDAVPTPATPTATVDPMDALRTKVGADGPTRVRPVSEDIARARASAGQTTDSLSSKSAADRAAMRDPKLDELAGKSQADFNKAVGGEKYTGAEERFNVEAVKIRAEIDAMNAADDVGDGDLLGAMDDQPLSKAEGPRAKANQAAKIEEPNPFDEQPVELDRASVPDAMGALERKLDPPAALPPLTKKPPKAPGARSVRQERATAEWDKAGQPVSGAMAQQAKDMVSTPAWIALSPEQRVQTLAFIRAQNPLLADAMERIAK